MSALPHNPDTRPLPAGWITQYDSNYKAWFYVNTNAQPPVTTWEHPGPPPQAPPPPGPSTYSPPGGPPPPNAPRPGYEQGYGPGNSRGGYGDGPSGGYGGSPYDRPPENYAGPPRGYSGPPRGYSGPPGPYNGPPDGYGARPGGAYPQYGEGYAQGGYDRRNPVPEDRGQSFGGGMFAGGRQSADKKQGGAGFGKLALGLGGGALALFAGKEFLDHEEHKAYEQGEAAGYDQGFDNGFVDGAW